MTKQECLNEVARYEASFELNNKSSAIFFVLGDEEGYAKSKAMADEMAKNARFFRNIADLHPSTRRAAIKLWAKGA